MPRLTLDCRRSDKIYQSGIETPVNASGRHKQLADKILPEWNWNSQTKDEYLLRRDKILPEWNWNFGTTNNNHQRDRIKSYQSGIETCYIAPINIGSCQIKSYQSGIETRSASTGRRRVSQIKSYQSGIETCLCTPDMVCCLSIKSYQSGIETQDCAWLSGAGRWDKILPEWNWNFNSTFKHCT